MRRGQVNYPYIRWLVVGSVPGSMLSVFVITPWFEQSGIDVEKVTAQLLGTMLFVVGVITILENRFFAGRLRDSQFIRSEAVQRRYKEPILVVGGLVIGMTVGLTSVGSGAILMAVLLLVSELNVLVLIGTDLVHATILLGAAGAAHSLRGHVEFGIVGALLVGSIPGIWLGSRLAQIVPTTPLRYALSVLLMCVGVKLLVS
jgi:uncharacterized membrane protein YfcA